MHIIYLYHQAPRRHLNRWLTFSMATWTVKCGAVGATVTACGILLYLLSYKDIVRQSDFVTNYDTTRKTFEEYTNENKYFNVHKYRLEDELLVLKGQFNGSVQSNVRSIYIKGLSHLINQAKTFIISDEKLEKSSFRDGHFFTVERTVKEVNCRAIINGDKNEIAKAENISKTHPKVAIKPQEYIEMTKNCSKFISDRGYISESLTDVEKNFHIAYSLLMFKDIEQSERLLRAIYRPQNFYCIHVDSKTSDDTFQAISDIADCFENMFISRKRHNVQWGTMTVLEPELLCMEELWNKSRTWKYFINLTGQEFPLRTNYELVQILKAYNGANDLEATVEKYVYCSIEFFNVVLAKAFSKS